MPKTSVILSPKTSPDLKGNSKPEVLIINSPWDRLQDSAVKFCSIRKYIEDAGYRVLNKKQVNFDLRNFDHVSSWRKRDEVVVWLECHGVPGYVFGSECDLASELEAIKGFALFISSLKKTLHVEIPTIVLGACNGATEYVSASGTNYFLSPARLLSFLLPETSIIGFVGQNNNVKLNNLWCLNKKGTYDEVYLPLLNGCI